MRFTQRLLIAFVLPSLLFVAALAAAIGSLINTQHEFDHYLRTEEAMANDVREMYAQGLQMGQAMRNIVLDPQNPTAYKNLDAAREAYDTAYADAQGISVTLPPVQAAVQALAELRAAQGRAQQQVLDTLKTDPAQAVALLNKAETPAWRQLRAALLKLRDELGVLAQATQGSVNDHADRARWMSLGLAVLAMGVSLVLGLMLRRSLRREIGGDPAVARATLREIASGDLTGRIPPAQDPQSLMGALEGMQVSMRTLVAQVHESSAGIEVATREISLGNHDLSARTEQTASSLQETAASMEQLNSTMKGSADAARQASQMAVANAEVAARGQVVGQVVATMDQINHSSKKINDIIGVIDGIAFQTNILALNAAVEAARAGEQGRGFAVVAAEVRNLAQRSAEAAKEIKALIGTSVDKVEAGTRLVAEAGSTIGEVVANAQRVADIIAEITAASGEQSSGIGQVNTAVSHLDQMTQQNAALVEESAAAAESLKDQASRLIDVVRTFRIEPTR